MLTTPENYADIDTEQGDFPVLPAGQYPMIVVMTKEDSTAKGGCIVLELEVMSGPYVGRKVWDRLWVYGDGIKRMKLVSERLGVRLAPGQSISLEQYTGRSAVVTLKIEPYNGEPRNKVAFDGYAPIELAAGAADAAGQPKKSMPF